jgi:hypothetical protein
MSDNLLKINEKNKLCEYKAANPKMTADQLIEFCVNESKNLAENPDVFEAANQLVLF